MHDNDIKDLARLLDPDHLRHLAGEVFFGRGQEYFTNGAVRSLRHLDAGIDARVLGTETYRVRMKVQEGELEYDCDCPVGRDALFCKHCVAAGLAWNNQILCGSLTITPEGTVVSEYGSDEELLSYLEGLGKDALLALLLEHMEEDEALHRKLTLCAAQARGSVTDISPWKDAFMTVVRKGEYISYHEAYGHVREIEDVIDSFDDLLKQKHADAVIKLTEYALSELEEAIGYMDDSDGMTGELLCRLQDLHLRACQLARPDPLELAGKLFIMESEADYDIFYQAIETYADVLGKTGRAAYRRLAETEWAKILPLKPNDKDPDRYGKRFRITSIMETLARTDHDIEALIKIKAHDLSHSYSFLKIAETYQEAHMPDQALEWAEKGWTAFPAPAQDERLRKFIVEAYQNQGQHDKALELGWQGFTVSPDMEGYQLLEKYAGKAIQWPQWREKALAHIREQIDKFRPSPKSRWSRPFDDHSLLVELFLHEGDPDTAWEEAETGGCSDYLWLALAKYRGEQYPADAIRVYRNHIARLLQATGDRIYQESVSYLEKIKTLSARLDEERTFHEILNDIRAEQKRKRNLMKMLDQKGWG
ncbi:MAG: hypothetical protein JKY45_00640 [Emcibacter sp.]|nr:hypothetical protein [Emcibacter sp.]